MLNYLNLPTACDAAFGVFISVWFLTRHVFYLMVCWSLFYDVPGPHWYYGCFDTMTGAELTLNGGTDIWKNMVQPFDNPGGPICFNFRIRMCFLGLLLALQVLTIIWFGMIIRVAYRVIVGKGSEDPRSDDEEAEDESEEEEIEIDVFNAPEKAEGPRYIVEEADGESVNLIRRVDSPTVPLRRSSRKSPVAKASGISIPGHADKKELLGRIGCDKPS